MNNYILRQLKKAIIKNHNKAIPRAFDVYNGNPIKNNICITLTTSTGKWGGLDVLC